MKLPNRKPKKVLASGQKQSWMCPTQRDLLWGGSKEVSRSLSGAWGLGPSRDGALPSGYGTSGARQITKFARA